MFYKPSLLKKRSIELPVPDRDRVVKSSNELVGLLVSVNDKYSKNDTV